MWLQVREGYAGLHVNGRPVRRMALLRAGDAVFVDGNEWLLLGETPPSAPAEATPCAGPSRRSAHGAARRRRAHHGRSFTLDQPRLVGAPAECDIRIDDPAFADATRDWSRMPQGVVLRDLGSHEGSLVNGWPVRDALLRPGDQVVFDPHRFVVEAPIAARLRKPRRAWSAPA